MLHAAFWATPTRNLIAYMAYGPTLTAKYKELFNFFSNIMIMRLERLSISICRVSED